MKLWKNILSVLLVIAVLSSVAGMAKEQVSTAEAKEVAKKLL